MICLDPGHTECVDWQLLWGRENQSWPSILLAQPCHGAIVAVGCIEHAVSEHTKPFECGAPCLVLSCRAVTAYHF